MNSTLQGRDYYFVGVLLRSLLLIYVLMAVMRGILYVYNKAAFVGLSWEELSYIFFVALRFDTVSIAYVNSLFILWHLWPSEFRFSVWHIRVGRLLYVAGNSAMLMVEFGDVGYFPYAFRRVTRTDFEMQQDFFAMLPTFLQEFWWMVILSIAAGILLWRYYGSLRDGAISTERGKHYRVKQWAAFLIGAGLTFVGMRGGLQPRPLTSAHAVNYVSNICYAPLPCNATLNVIHSAQQRTLLPLHYYDSLEIERYKPIMHYPAPPAGTAQRRYNVVVVIVESFGKEYVSHFNPKLAVRTTFMDSLCARGLLFTRANANGTRSTQGVLGVTAGLPSLMQDPFMFSAFAQNRLGAFSNRLSKVGYTSAFFHAGQNGTMNFDAYARTVGYDKYFGKNEYDKVFPDSAELNFDGDWGVWEWPFMRYTVQEINKLDTPFFASYFTIAPHHPYNVPAEYAAQFPDEEPMYTAIRYADESLRIFFEEAEKQSWYKNTLFIITADHIGAAINPTTSMRPIRYQIPIIFFHPTDTMFQRRESAQMAQQIDILPTTLRYLGYPLEFDAFGRDLLQPSFENFSVTYDSGLFQIMDTSYSLIFDGDSTVALFNYAKDTFLVNNYRLEDVERVRYMESHLRAWIQAHHNGYIYNKLPQ